PEPPRPGAASGDVDAAEVRRRWNDVVALVNRSNKPIAALMRDAVLRELDGDTLVLTVKSRVLGQMVSKGAAVITDALYEELGIRWQIRCEVAGDQGAPTAPRSAPGAAPRPAPAPPSRPTSGAPPASAASGAGAGRADRAVPGGVPASRSAGDTDWPEPARPGGPSAAGGGDGPTRERTAGASARPSGTPAAPAVDSAASRTIGNVPAAGRGARAADGTEDPDWAGEPPFDPDYDSPAGGGIAYEGFAPGDEPLDGVVDEQAVHETGEQQALRLLKEALGAEPIDEADR
ncbi:MAG TPA: DNA polymerase III subunit gamma and tau, partial [Micromonosporaceae bacterium]|nr:DNA polymerase III subunit gamma and tau [Micromonosporaceae bacterium]